MTLTLKFSRVSIREIFQYILAHSLKFISKYKNFKNFPIQKVFDLEINNDISISNNKSKMFTICTYKVNRKTFVTVTVHILSIFIKKTLYVLWLLLETGHRNKRIVLLSNFL